MLPVATVHGGPFRGLEVWDVVVDNDPPIQFWEARNDMVGNGLKCSTAVDEGQAVVLDYGFSGGFDL